MLRRVAMCQMNARVGDIKGNTARIITGIHEAKRRGAQVVTFPELAITGYPPEDLVYRPAFVKANSAAISEILPETAGITAVVGFIRMEGDKRFNSAIVLKDGGIVHRYDKLRLPNFSVFDEKRYFEAGDAPTTFQLDGQTVGVNICEDIWHADGPTAAQAAAGASIILNINASPMHVGKLPFRFAMLAERARQSGTTIFYNNLVGGQDELVFDGGSMAIGPDGRLLALGRQYVEDMVMFDLDRPATLDLKTYQRTEEIYEALKLAIADYMIKSGAGFKGVVLGLSGGIDSAVTLAMAVAGLGKDKVTAVYMPSQYSANMSYEDAKALAENLGVRFLVQPIQEIVASYSRGLAPIFDGLPANPKDTTDQNLQARARGNILMALSNKFGWLVLTTGNKSEMSVGYATLYGDMAGGFAVLKDIWKQDVFALARFINRDREVIPNRTITRPPSAELKAGQRDDDDLPPYETLDPILRMFIEQNFSPEEIIAKGFTVADVNKIVRMATMAEYKRRQAPPGPKVTERAFGKDWRMPICDGWRG